MSGTRLNPLDAAWILTETRATPNHVGGLLIFKLPDGAARDFLRLLMRDFRTYRGFTAPWNRRLKYTFQLNPVPEWVEDDDVDLEYHVRHGALPPVLRTARPCRRPPRTPCHCGRKSRHRWRNRSRPCP